MGERDPGIAPPPEAPPWPQRAVLAGALLVLALAVLGMPPVDSPTAATPRSLVAGGLEELSASIAGSRGTALLGVLMLALTAALGCYSLERRVGSAAALLITLVIFGSAAWALVWADGAALVPLALAVAAFSLAYSGSGFESPTEIYQPRERGRMGVFRWLAVGLLLAELLPSSPLLAALLVPAVLAVPSERRGLDLTALLGGFGVGLAVEAAVQGPSWLTGPIGVAAESFSLDPALVGRNLLGLAAGRNVGLLAGFAPLPLLLLLGWGATRRPGLMAVGLALPVLAMLLLPFDFAAGWLNLVFLPVYGALWHLPMRRPRRWQWAVVALLCGLATWPLWTGPRAALADGGVRLAAAWPRSLLPYESSLRSLPNRGELALAREGLRLRAVDGCRLLDDSGRIEVDGVGPATLWLAMPLATEMVALELGPAAPSSFEVVGATAGSTVFRPDGRVGFEVMLDQPLGRHRLAWDERTLAMHLIGIRVPDWKSDRPLRFRLLAAAQP